MSYHRIHNFNSLHSKTLWKFIISITFPNLANMCLDFFIGNTVSGSNCDRFQQSFALNFANASRTFCLNNNRTYPINVALATPFHFGIRRTQYCVSLGSAMLPHFDEFHRSNIRIVDIFYMFLAVPCCFWADFLGIKTTVSSKIIYIQTRRQIILLALRFQNYLYWSNFLL